MNYIMNQSLERKRGGERGTKEKERGNKREEEANEREEETRYSIRS
jgi:hypothetical protein